MYMQADSEEEIDHLRPMFDTPEEQINFNVDPS